MIANGTLKVNDFASINGTLTTIDLLIERFRYPKKRDGIMAYFNKCLDHFVVLSLTTDKTVSMRITTTAVRSTPVLFQLIKTQRLCCRIFFLLNAMGLPDVFVYNVDKWMNAFKKYLTIRYLTVEESGAEGVALVDELRLAVCDNISHYMEKKEELFQKYLSSFVEVVWSLCVVASDSPSCERLTVIVIKFLIIVSTSIHHALFAWDEFLQHITQSIVIPNVMLRDEDKELFKINYVEFIRKDMKGSDLDTR